ncbi:MAG: helix-turn-helix domain-containing protein [Fluviicola sp.]
MDKGEFNELFGQFIKVKRKSMNWTQNDLAERINNDFQNISRLERGEINPSIHWISELAKAFGSSLGELLTEFDAFTIKQSIPSERSRD